MKLKHFPWLVAASCSFLGFLFIFLLYIPHLSLQQTGGVRPEDDLISLLLGLCGVLLCFCSFCLLMSRKTAAGGVRHLKAADWLLILLPVVIPASVLVYLLFFFYSGPF